MTGEEMEGQT